MDKINHKKRLKKIRRMKIRYKIACALGGGHAKWLRKHDVFAEFGKNVLFTPDTLPNNPKLVKIHNNVKIASGVTFYEHDVINQVFRDLENNTVNWQRHMMGIEIMDNVFIGAHSVIVGDVRIGPNAIIGAGSVVTRDVPEGAIVAGNPAVVVGSFDAFLAKRTEMDGNQPLVSDEERCRKLWERFDKETRKSCPQKK